jgi:enoyl-CoA hydratase/carnithine racemase
MRTVSQELLILENVNDVHVIRLHSADGMNRLTKECVLQLGALLDKLSPRTLALIITGNQNFFSAGADLHEISALNARLSFEFSHMGQRLMNFIEGYPTPVYAAISGYCMGGGLDLALACHRRIAAPNAIFGHRGASLGLITGWGGTQRLPRLVGKGIALQMFASAEKMTADNALRV